MLTRAFSIAYRMPPVKRLLWRSWYGFLAADTATGDGRS